MSRATLVCVYDSKQWPGTKTWHRWEATVWFGSHFNLVFDPALDRSTPGSLNRSKAALVLVQGLRDLGLCDIWRKFNRKLKDFSFFSNLHNSYCRMFLISFSMIVRVTDCSYLAAILSDNNLFYRWFEIWIPHNQLLPPGDSNLICLRTTNILVLWELFWPFRGN